MLLWLQNFTKQAAPRESSAQRPKFLMVGFRLNSENQKIGPTSLTSDSEEA